MNNDFIRIRSLEGELKLSHKKRDYGVTVSTKELVLQKPHANYHIKLDHIVSIMPFAAARAKPVTFTNRRSGGNEITKLGVGHGQYKFYVREATVHNRSGIFQLGPAEFIIPIMRELLEAVAMYGELNAIDE